MTLDDNTAVLLIGTFSALGFSISFTVPTIVGAAEILRPKPQAEIIPGRRPELHSFSQRVVIVFARDWPRFFFVLSIMFFIAGIFDILFVCGSLVGYENNLGLVLDGSADLVLVTLMIMTIGWVWLLVCSERYSPDEVQKIAEEAAKAATVKEYVESGGASKKKTSRATPKKK